MYAILFMNALVPFINRVTQPRVFGQPRRKPKGAEAVKELPTVQSDGGRHRTPDRPPHSAQVALPAS